MLTPSTTVTGLSDLQAELRHLQYPTVQELLVQPVTAGAEVAAQASRTAAPVLTGELRSAIDVTPTPMGADMEIGSDHGGAVIHGTKRGMKANPFPWRAMERNAVPIQAAYEAGVDRVLRQIGLK